MPWEKQFDSDEVLGKAMQAFWAKGYEELDIAAETAQRRALERLAAKDA